MYQSACVLYGSKLTQLGLWCSKQSTVANFVAKTLNQCYSISTKFSIIFQRANLSCISDFPRGPKRGGNHYPCHNPQGYEIYKRVAQIVYLSVLEITQIKADLKIKKWACHQEKELHRSKWFPVRNDITEKQWPTSSSLEKTLKKMRSFPLHFFYNITSLFVSVHKKTTAYNEFDNHTCLI